MKTIKEIRVAVGFLVAKNDEIANHVSAGTATEEMRSEFESNCKQIETFNKDISILESQQRSKPAMPVSTEVVDSEGKEIAKHVSMRDFHDAAISGRAEGFVKEMCQLGKEEQRNANVPSSGREIVIPMKALDAITNKVQKRATMQLGTGSLGGNAVQTTIMTFIDALWPKLYFSKFGVTPMTGLYGNVAFPRNTSITASWKTEVASVTGTNPTIDQVTLSPSRLPNLIEASKNLLNNSQVSEQYLLNLIMKSIVEQLEYASIQGSGTAPVPHGIINTSGIGSVAIGTNGGAPTYQSLLDLISSLGANNANYSAENAGFLSTPQMMTKLMATQTFPSSSNGQPVTQIVGNADNPITAGYKSAFTSNAPSTLTKGSNSDCHAIIFGDFSELIIGQWGGLEMYVDPITKMEQGITRVYVESFWDIAVKHAASFAAILDARNV